MTDREPLALECALRSAAASGITNVADFKDTTFSKNSRAQASLQIYASNSKNLWYMQLEPIYHVQGMKKIPIVASGARRAA